jgi:hypothetical protein
MSEKPSLHEKYERLTPIERNRELREFYARIPIHTDIRGLPRERESDAPLTPELLANISKNIMNDLQRRLESEHRNRLYQNLSDLLAFSYITQSFQDHIILIHKRCSMYGIKEGEFKRLADQEFSFALDSENPESAGIFDPIRAMHLERERFQQVRETISTRGTDEQAVYYNWRLDYWKKFGIDPRKR